MTVSVNRSRVQYSGDGSVVAFAVTFSAITQEEIVVTVTTSGVDSVKTLATHYSLTAAPFTTGTVTFLTSPTDYTPASGTTITISRSLDLLQQTDYQANDALDAETLEEGFDKAMMAAQQLDGGKDRTLKYAETLTDDFSGDTEFTTITSTAADRASKYLSFDTAGKLSVSAEITGISAAETSVAVGDVLTYSGSQWVNSKILARISQINDSNGNEVLKFITTGSAVNEITVTNAATGDAPTIAATGEADKGIHFENSEAEELLKLASVSTAVNEVTITNAATTNGPIISATGGDTDIDVDITPKGTGELKVDGKIKSINGQSFTQSAFHGALILGF
jgi:hypothetical protein